MRSSSLAVDLEDLAASLRRQAAAIRKSGRPIDVPWPHADGGNKTLHRLTSLDLENDAGAFEADAAKLRKLYS